MDASFSSIGSLPRFSTRFFGRDRDRKEITTLLLNDDIRLVTLLGPGGTGKTRLAVAIAEDFIAGQPIEAIFVDLTPVQDNERMLEVLASSLQVTPEPGQPLVDAIAGELTRRSPLVILDNMESVREARDTVSAIIARTPGVSFLATSRVPLRIQGEHRYPVDPLEGPATPDMEASPAIALFLDRAQAVRPGFRLTTDNRDDIQAICDRVDRLPLAIELAAARLQIISPADLRTRLADRLTLLSRGPYDLPDRHQGIYRTIAWSADMLDDAHRDLLLTLSVFRGSFPFAGVVAIHGGDPTTVADLLTDLMDESLLQPVPATGDDVRFRMLQTVRDYAADSAERAGRVTSLRQRHVGWARAWAAEIDRGLMGEQQGLWTERGEQDYENLRAALDWSLAKEEVESTLELVGSMWPLWCTSGRLVEGRALIDRALHLAGDAQPALRMSALNGMGALCSLQGDLAAATSATTEALGLARIWSDQNHVAALLNNLGILAENTGSLDDAVHVYQEALAILEPLDDLYRTAGVLNNLGSVENRRGNLEVAEQNYRRAAGLSRAMKDQAGIARVQHNLGLVLINGGRYEEAMPLLLDALTRFEALDDTQGIAQVLCNLSITYNRIGNQGAARDSAIRAVEIARRSGNDPTLALALERLGELAASGGDSDAAMQHFREALVTCRALADDQIAIPHLEHIARLAATYGDDITAATIGAWVRAARSRLNLTFAPAWENKNPLPGNNTSAPDLSLLQVIDLALAVDSTVQPFPNQGAARVSSPAGVDHGLTTREIDVLRLVAEGHTNADIGNALFISPFTVKTHVANLLRKLDVESRAAAATWAARQGMLESA